MWRVRPLRPFRSTWPGSLTTCGQSAHLSIKPEPHGTVTDMMGKGRAENADVCRVFTDSVVLFHRLGLDGMKMQVRFVAYLGSFIILAAHDLKL